MFMSVLKYVFVCSQVHAYVCFQMSFLEFFEALIGCAEKYVTLSVVKDPSTPRPSTSVTKDESMYSIPGSPSRLTSQVIWPQGYKTFFMLSSAETKIYPAHKC